jgi:hypothetical protein
MSDAQNTANKANAQLSTGPRTENGKAISSRNALKHGLTAKTVLLPGEDDAAYQALAASMLKDYEPLSTVEAALATELIDLHWRLQRASSVEARILSVDAPDFKALNYVSLHAARMNRQFSTTLQELQDLHRTNAKKRQDQLAQAETIYRADQILERPSTRSANGFDFTEDFFETLFQRKEALDEAENAIQDFEVDPDEGFDDDEEDDFDDDEDDFEDEVDDAA